MATLSAQEHEELAYEDNTPTPPGWRRKLIPYIGKGLIPARTDVVFVAPGGEEFRSKAQLQLYLKKNKGSPSISEFIWITDETPRRSSRSASRRSKSPPKTMSKRKPATEAPLQEAKATKRNCPEKESVVVEALRERKKRPNKQSGKVTPNKSKAVPNEGEEGTNGDATTCKETNGSLSPSIKAKEEKQKHPKDTKKTKSVKADSVIGESSHDNARTGESEEEKLESNGREGTEANGKEEALEEPAVEEKDHAETQKMQTEVQKCKDLENEDAGDDGTTTSLLGSDFSAEGMEANSDSFESESARPSHEEEVNKAQVEANAPEGN